MEQLVVSISVPFPLFVGGLVLSRPPEVLGRVGARRMLLMGVSFALLGAREAVRLFRIELSLVIECAYFGLLLVLIGAMIWSWRQGRHPSPASTMSAGSSPRSIS